VATPDELNASISKALAAAIPTGLDLSAGSSLASIPQTIYSQTIPPMPSFLQRLQDFRDAATQPQTPQNQPATVEGRRNEHWREVAKYEAWVFPLFLYLENVDWQKVVTWYETKWQRDFATSLWFHKRKRGCQYIGRLIQRHELLDNTTHRLKLTLPIPTPVEYGRRRLQEAQALYAGVFATMAQEAATATSDSRRLLADRLETASRRLGRHEQNRLRQPEKWLPDWQLQSAVEPKTTRTIQSLSAGELGQVIAKVEDFWQHWHAFHRAEQESIPAAPAQAPVGNTSAIADSNLTHLHPAIQQVAGKLFIDGHLPQSIQSACTALEKAIQQKAGQSGSVTGTILIGRVFHKDNPLLWLADDQGEREGYGLLYRGLLQAIRNHYSHNLTEIHAPRALEWLGFISALFYKLDESVLAHPKNLTN
jgi:hypothetical protein